MAKKKDKRLDSQCRVHLHIHSKLHRLRDADGTSAKAAIDGLVLAGVLPDDRPEYVSGVSYSQKKISKKDHESTEITITAEKVDGDMQILWSTSKQAF